MTKILWLQIQDEEVRTEVTTINGYGPGVVIYEGKEMKASKLAIETAIENMWEYVEISYRKVEGEDFMIKIKKIDVDVD